MQDTITLEIETNGQITSHELPVEERDGRKVVRLIADVRGGGGGGQVEVSGTGYAVLGGGAKGGGGGHDTVTIWSGQADMIHGAGRVVFGPYTVPPGSGTVYVKMSSRDLDRGGGKGG